MRPVDGKTLFDYSERDSRIRHEVARVLECPWSDVVALPWDEILEMAEELEISTGWGESWVLQIQ